MKDRVNPHADAQSVQNNILITQDGQACLGDFAIDGMLKEWPYSYHQPENLRYMAPERISVRDDVIWVTSSSKESDVYSLAMTSFSVRASVGNHPTTRYNCPVTIRSSRGYCRITEGMWRI